MFKFFLLYPPDEKVKNKFHETLHISYINRYYIYIDTLEGINELSSKIGKDLQ